MKAQVEIVTLAMAKQLLEQNPINRRRCLKLVARYASDMKAGRWNNNGQGIVISSEGNLLDGQHRMAAIIQAQTPVAMVVVRGVPSETFITMDSGKARSLSDVLGIEGHVHTITMAGVARTAYSYAAGTALTYSGSKASLEAFVKAHPYLAEVPRKIGNARRVFPGAPVAAILFLANEARNLDYEVDDFVSGLLYGEQLSRGDARLTLREWFTDRRIKERGALKTATAFAAAGRAWNAFVSGKELLVIKQLDMPSRDTLPIFGFDPALFSDVPDIRQRQKEVSRTNLAKSPSHRGRVAPVLGLVG